MITLKAKCQPLATFKTTTKDYVLNVYRYHNQLVGIVEDTTYLQIFELDKYMTPTDFIDWRFHVRWPTPLIDVYGKPFKNDTYMYWLHDVSKRTGLPVFKTAYKRYY